MNNYRLIQILTNAEGGLTADQRLDIDVTGANPTFSALTVNNNLNVTGQITGDLSNNTSFITHTGDTSQHQNVTGGTVIGSTIYLDTNHQLSAATVDVSSLTATTSNAVTIGLEWVFNNSITASNPGDKKFRVNSTTASAVTAIYYNDFTNGGIDAGNILNALDNGDIVYLQQKDNSENASLYSVTGTPTDNVGWWTIPVSHLSGNNLPLNGKKTLNIFYGVTSGAFTNFTVSGDTGSQIIDDGNTLYIAGGEAIKTTASATDRLTVDLDITGTTAEGSPTTGDKLIIWEATSKTHRNIDWSDLPGSGGGEANTATNVGNGAGIFRDKTGTTINLKTLTSTGATVTFIEKANTVNLEASSRITASVQTTNATPTTGDTIDTLTDNATNLVEVYVKAYVASAANWGIWKRTLAVTSVSGTVTIQHENADVDKNSAGLSANSIDFVVNGSNIDIVVTGIGGTTINWETAYEIIL
jgi:hypothetical protein